MKQKVALEHVQPSRLDIMPKGEFDLMKLLQPVQMPRTSGLQASMSNPSSFLLGDEVLAFGTTGSVGSVNDDSEFPVSYLIREGRVRILCHNNRLGRLASASTLGAGDIVGGDQLFCGAPLAYHAIAATDCQLLPIPPAQMHTFASRSSPLFDPLNQKIKERQQLVFFKQFTQLYSLPSEVLKNTFLPRLREIKLAPGETLSQGHSLANAHFWLRAGQLCRQGKAVPMGTAWTSPALEEDWRAQSEVVIYQLPLNPWEVSLSLRS